MEPVASLIGKFDKYESICSLPAHADYCSARFPLMGLKSIIQKYFSSEGNSSGNIDS